ncbi:hypothetical protein [Levilactobacillus enshiensis]|uniref:hypothetical protein n=1 Tax=Levilactobacillus enshiensis TaxID=2590213 RepID=UPI00117BD743|nr:hypothetical protein [Levilactobacillus enshiensis]
MFDFDDMIDEWGIPLEIKLKSGNDSGHYEAGEWVPDEGVPLKVKEPLLPPGTNASPGTYYVGNRGGEVEAWDMDWYSKQPNIPDNTVVNDIERNISFKVAKKSDYQPYAGITIYNLEAVTTNGQAV